MGSLFLSAAVVRKQTYAGMLRPFPVHFIPLQSNSTQSNLHDSHGDTENCMKYGFSYETDCWRNYCVERFYWKNLDILCRCRSLTMVDLTECCMLTVQGSNTVIKIPSYLTQFLKKNDQNSTWKSLHMSHSIFYSHICHKYFHIMGWKDTLNAAH